LFKRQIKLLEDLISNLKNKGKKPTQHMKTMKDIHMSAANKQIR
jgi:hypothetical protein